MRTALASLARTTTWGSQCPVILPDLKISLQIGVSILTLCPDNSPRKTEEHCAKDTTLNKAVCIPLSVPLPSSFHGPLPLDVIWEN